MNESTTKASRRLLGPPFCCEKTRSLSPGPRTLLTGFALVGGALWGSYQSHMSLIASSNCAGLSSVPQILTHPTPAWTLFRNRICAGGTVKMRSHWTREALTRGLGPYRKLPWRQTREKSRDEEAEGGGCTQAKELRTRSPRSQKRGRPSQDSLRQAAMETWSHRWPQPRGEPGCCTPQAGVVTC